MPIDPTEYVSKKIPAMPYDNNRKPSYVLMLAITDVDGNVIGYLPPAAENNGDGTASIKVTSA
jgi:hypothetical protein